MVFDLYFFEVVYIPLSSSLINHLHYQSHLESGAHTKKWTLYHRKQDLWGLKPENTKTKTNVHFRIQAKSSSSEQ